MLDYIMSWISQAIADTMEGAVGLLAPLLSFDSELFLASFPYAADAYTIFQGVAIAIILLLAAFQMLPFFMGKSQTTPTRAGLFAILAVFGVYYGNFLLTGIMSIAQYPYNELLGFNASGYFNLITGFSQIDSVITDATAGVSIIIYIFLFLLIGIAFLKLLIEAVERYLMLFVLIYLSPLAASSLASEVTSGICKRFFSMFLAQCLLLILNVWSLKMTISMFGALDSVAIPILTLFCGYAFLRIASRLDSFLNQIGLNAAVTGIGLGNELIASGMALMAMGRNTFGSKSISSGSNGGAAGGILGLGKTLGRAMTKINPITGAAKAGTNALGALGKTVKQGAAAAKDGAAGTSGNIFDKMKAGAQSAGQAMKENIGDNLHQASMKTQDESLWARAFGKLNPNSSWNGMNMSGNTSLSDQQRQDVADNPALAGKAMSSFQNGAETMNSADVSSMMQGVGLDSVDPNATEMLDVGYGNLDSKETQFHADENGMSASYERNGMVHDWDVKNANQFNALSPEEQTGYTRFKNNNGDSYYYRHTTTRAPTDAQRQSMAAAANMAAFTADPSSQQFTPGTLRELKKNPQMGNDALNDMARTGVQLDNSPATKSNMLNMAQSMDLPRTKQSGEVMQSLHDGIADGSTNLTGTPDNFHMSRNVNGQDYGMSFVTAEGAAGMDTAQMIQDGYQALPNGLGYVKYDAPLSSAEKAANDVSAAAANPNGHPLSESTLSEMSRKPELANDYLNNMHPSAAITDPDQIAGVMRGVKVNGSENRELASMHSEAINRLTNNNFDGAYMNNRGIGVNWTDADGKSHSYSLMTDSAASMLPQDSYKELDMQRFKSGGQAYHASVSHPMTTAEKATDEYNRFIANPASNGLSAETAAHMQKNPKMAADLIPNLAASGTSVPYNAETAQTYSDVFASMKTNGIRSDVKEAGVMALRSGEVNGTPRLDGNGMHFEFEHNGATHAISVLPESRVADTPAAAAQPDAEPKYDMEYLNNRGYQANNVEGTRYYTLDDAGAVGTKRFDDTAVDRNISRPAPVSSDPVPFEAPAAPAVQPAPSVSSNVVAPSEPVTVPASAVAPAPAPVYQVEYSAPAVQPVVSTPAAAPAPLDHSAHRNGQANGNSQMPPLSGFRSIHQ